jgi:lipopolysaccharide biosynthesis protein
MISHVPTPRNEKCPCGSGKRYKHCHGNVAGPSASALPATNIFELMARALAAQKAGLIEQARNLYDQALTLDPKEPNALHMRGVVALTQGEPEDAIRFIRAAISAGLDTDATKHNLMLAKEASRVTISARAMQTLSNLEQGTDDQFVSPDEVQLLAFYLPQFHRIPENDAWWGEGFTEWTNVRRAVPNFLGHDQPRIPGELGYYNLLDAHTRQKQATLAKQYGINGFCYYYYWFNGRRLLEQPLDLVLRSGEPDLPFCAFWANENWSKRWDGGNHELLVEQSHSDADDIAFMESLLPYFEDKRYIRIEGRPLLMIYRIDLFPNARRTIKRWREVCRAHGMAEPYIVKADTRASDAPHVYSADASLEFPPHRLSAGSTMTRKLQELNKEYKGTIIDYRSAAAYLATAVEPAHTHFKTVMPSWDNTARRQLDGTMLVNSSPDFFCAWLRESIARAQEMLPPGRRIVFINAWNEWAEGAYLEPDQTNGRAMLEAAWSARFRPSEFKRLRELVDEEFRRA